MCFGHLMAIGPKQIRLASANADASLNVGVTGFEPATTRPPDAYSNRAELHPDGVLVVKRCA